MIIVSLLAYANILTDSQMIASGQLHQKIGGLLDKLILVGGYRL